MNQKGFTKIILVVVVIIIFLVIACFALLENIQRTTPTSSSTSFMGNSTRQIALDTENKKFWAQAVLLGSDDLDKTEVNIDLSFAKVPAGSEYIANIYKGSCNNGGSIKYLLSNIKTDNKGTVSKTILETSLSNLLTELPLSIKLYKRSNFLTPILVRYVNTLVKPIACGNI